MKKIVCVAVFSMLLLMFQAGYVHAEYPLLPLLKVMPEEIACHEYGESFSASVWLMEEDHAGVDGFWDIEGFDLWVYFDPSFVNAVEVSIDPDGWWNSFWPRGIFKPINNIDNNAGTVHVAFLGMSEMGSHTPPNGIGRILNIDFVAIATEFTPQTGTEIVIGNSYLPGFPHPERPYPPWNDEIEVIIPHVVENAIFHFSPVGDVNLDGEVNILDLAIAASSYGCREGEPNWNPFVDVAPPYGVIDILDLVTCVGHYGEEYQ